MPGLLSRHHPTGLSALSRFSSPPQEQLSLANALCAPPVRKSALTGLAQCLAPQKQIYVLSVEMDLETKRALERGETISVWRC